MFKTELALGLVRVTEASALQSAKYMGRGNQIEAEQAAIDGMKKAFEMLPINGTVVINEKKSDGSPIINIGEKLGMGEEGMVEMDIALDPLDGSNLISKGLPNAMSVVSMGEKGSLFQAPDMYMKKIVVGPLAKGAIDINKSPKENIINVSKALNKNIEDITVIVQERERHKYIIDQAREVGARVKLFGEGDIAAAIACGFQETGIDILMSIGGAREGVITATAIKCLGGEMQAKIIPQDDEDIKKCNLLGINDINKVLTIEDLVKGDNVYFSATGITECDLLKGVVFSEDNYATTYSVVMRSKTGTIRFVDAKHNLGKSSLLNN